jgi:hypothetical protein
MLKKPGNDFFREARRLQARRYLLQRKAARLNKYRKSVNIELVRAD